MDRATKRRGGLRATRIGAGAPPVRGTDGGTGCRQIRDGRRAAPRQLGPSPVAKPEYFVSYAWGDDTSPEGQERETIVDRLCAEAEPRGIHIIRDKTTLRLGERITPFMRRIGAGDRVFVILSEKYLRSPYCMFELLEIWRYSRGDEADFRRRVRIYALPGTKGGTPIERTRHAATGSASTTN